MSKPPVTEYFTIGIFDFRMNNGRLDIGFADSHKLSTLLNTPEKHRAFGEFTSSFQSRMYNFIDCAWGMPEIMHLCKIYYEELENIIAHTNVGFDSLIKEFDEYFEINQLSLSRNMVPLVKPLSEECYSE